MSAVDWLNRDKTPAVRYEQFGWKDSETAFLWGRSLYTGSNILPASAVDEVATRGRLLNTKPGGSLERWSAAANKLFARDCEPHAFALLCSFAAPLMRFHSTDEGGALLVLVGPPGTGKTTALDAAGSVWGQHRALDLNTFDTRASRGVNLGVLGNLPVLYDELEKQDEDVLREFVTIFTNGRDRARATVDGGVRHEARTWQTIVIGAANRSVVELVAGRADSEALSSRILEFPGHLPEGMSDREGTALRNEMKNNCGFAADMYVRYLVQPEVIQWMRTTLVAKTDEVWKRTGLKSEHRFWVRTIGSVWVASLLVEKLGLLAFSPQRLIDWAIDHCVKVTTVPQTDERVRAISILTEYLNEHIGEMVIVPGPFKQHSPQIMISPKPRRLVMRYESNPPRWLLAERPFKDWLAKHGIAAKQCVAELAAAMIAREDRRLATLSAGTDIPGGQVACVELNGQHPALSGVLAPVEVLQNAKDAARTHRGRS